MRVSQFFLKGGDLFAERVLDGMKRITLDSKLLNTSIISGLDRAQLCRCALRRTDTLLQRTGFGLVLGFSFLQFAGQSIAFLG